MAFRFPLAIVLRLRQSLERREELALKTIAFECEQCRWSIERLSEQIVEAEKAREQMLRQPTSAFQLQSLLVEARVVAEQRRGLIDSLVLLERKRAEQLEVYRGARRDRQILSDLRSRKREEFNLQLDRAQQKRIDDIFAARAHRS